MSCNNVQILNFNHNIVEVGSDNKLIITDNIKCNSITIPQPVTNILQINSPGPQGPAGTGGGGSTDTGSLLTTASVVLNTITFTKGNGSTFPITVNTGSGGIVSGDYVTTSSFNAFTSSVVTTASFNSFTQSYNTGSFTGSFIGNGSGLTNLPPQTVNTSSLVTTASFNAFTSSVVTTSSFNSFTSSYNTGSFSGSFTGSLFGTATTASYVQNAQTASYVLQAVSASYASNGGVTQILQGSNITVSGNGTGQVTISSTGGDGNAFPYTGSAIITGSLVVTGSTTSTLGFTGSLQGTASWATNVQTASYALNAVSASYINPLNQQVIITGPLIQGLEGNIASGAGSHAEGDTTIASGSYSHAEGSNTTAIGSYSHAEGSNTVASGDNSHAEGESTQAIGYTSHAEGLSTSANGNYSHAEGNGTSANGDNSHAEGFGTIASGSSSHTEGNSTTALGDHSHAEGAGTITIGAGSHAEGSQTIAFADHSHAAGNFTVASGSYQSVIGAYNISSSVQSAFIIGNGTSNSNRSNLLFTSASTIQITGSLLVSGSITGSLFGTASFATTASYAMNAGGVPGGSNTQIQFNANNTFSGSSNFTFSSGSNTVTLTGSLNITGSTTQIGNNTLQGNTVLSGSITITGSVNALANITMGGTLRLDSATDPGNPNATASFLFTSASNTQTGFDLYYRQNNNLVKFKWIEGGISSGLLYGGIISASGATIYVSSGSGIIMSPNATFNKEINPTYTYVTWNNYSASAQYLTSSQNTYLYIDSFGVIRQQTNFFDQTQYEQAIPLGRVTHPNYSSITGVGSNVQTTYDGDSQQSAFIRAFGPLKINGFSINAQTNSLRFGVGSGVAYTLGGFYSQDPNSPSHYHGNAFATASIARAYRSGSGFRLDNNGGAFYTTVDPDYWDDGTGIPNTMATGDWQIQRAFFNPITGRTVVYYGQNTYTTLLNALQYLSTDTFEEGEFTANSLVFIGYLVLKGQTNNLTDTNNNRIINAGIFRNIAGSSAGGGAVNPSLDNLSDVTITSATNGQALIYDSGTWINGTPVSASHALTASYITASNVVGIVASASFATTASYALTSEGGGGGGISQGKVVAIATGYSNLF